MHTAALCQLVMFKQDWDKLARHLDAFCAAAKELKGNSSAAHQLLLQASAQHAAQLAADASAAVVNLIRHDPTLAASVVVDAKVWLTVLACGQGSQLGVSGNNTCAWLDGQISCNAGPAYATRAAI